MSIVGYKNRQKPLHEQTPEELRALAESRFKARELKPDSSTALREYREAEQAAISRMMQLRAKRLAPRGSA